MVELYEYGKWLINRTGVCPQIMCKLRIDTIHRREQPESENRLDERPRQPVYILLFINDGKLQVLAIASTWSSCHRSTTFEQWTQCFRGLQPPPPLPKIVH